MKVTVHGVVVRMSVVWSLLQLVHIKQGRQPRCASNKEYSHGARAQGRPSNRKSECHLRVHRAALRPRPPRPVPCTSVRLTNKTTAVGPYVIWNCRIYNSIQL